MNTLNNQHSESLRDVNLMISYLRDEVSLPQVIEIEDLMEKDELYRLSMEQLSEQLVDSTPEVLGQHISQFEQSLPQILVAQKDSFIAQLDKEAGNGDSDSSWMDKLRNGSNWQKLLLVAVIPVLVYFAVVPLSNEDDLHKNPTENLLPNKDVYAAQALIDNCANKGLGQRESEVNLYTAFIDEYSTNENYKAASQQLSSFSENMTLSDECKSRVDFYMANSYMALNDYKIAVNMFQEVLQNQGTPIDIKNATHWYLANIYLLQKDNDSAKEQFGNLLAGKDGDHLQKLTAKKYLEEAKTYMEFLESK